MSDRGRRVVVAVAVSVVGAVIGVAGAGHAYLREWGRASVWFSFVLGAGLALIGSFADPETATLSTLPIYVTGPIIALLVLNTVDTYYVARRSGANGAGRAGAPPDSGRTVACPSCGQEYDPELSFCPWCAGSRDENR
ncbi:MAG: zinc ribbon domain-containing protein [Haloplanus sp.]